MNYLYLFVFTILLSLSSFASEQLYRLNLKGYPKTHRECQATASAVSNEFGVKTGAKILLARCEQSRALSYDLEIQYSATKPLELVSSPSWPVYSNLDECQAKLNSENESFVSTTGLTPFMEYCSDYSETSTWKQPIHRYTTVFYALGAPSQLNKTFPIHMDHGQSVNADAVAREILEKTKAAGFPILNVYLDQRESESDLWLKFILKGTEANTDLKRKFLLKDEIQMFMTIPIPWELDMNPMVSESMKSCQYQRIRAMSLFDKSFSAPVVWFCMWNPNIFRARLYHLRIKAGEEGFEQFAPGEDGEPFSNDYTSNFNCEKDKARVVGYYKQKLGERVIGGLCSWETQSNPNLRVKMYIYAAQDY